METGMINQEQLAHTLEQQIKTAVDSAVQVHVARIIDELSLDPTWIAKIETLINQNYSQRFAKHLSTVDVTALIAKHIDQGIERWSHKLRTPGINDIATSCQLTVMDEAVVIEQAAVAKDVAVAGNAEIAGSLTVQDLVVRGTVNVDCRSWDEITNRASQQTLQQLTQDWRDQLVQQVLDLARRDGIDFAEVRINGKNLIQGDALTDVVKQSQLEQVGILRNLEVSGTASLNNTVTVTRGRVGINTNTPESSLTVWDEEVSIIVGKQQKNTAFVGTGRNQNLVLGVNRQNHLEIDPEGLVTIKQLRLDRFRIGHTDRVPGWAGSRGDFMLNHDFKPHQPFAWVCLGGLRWQPLMSVQ